MIKNERTNNDLLKYTNYSYDDYVIIHSWLFPWLEDCNREEMSRTRINGEGRRIMAHPFRESEMVYLIRPQKRDGGNYAVALYESLCCDYLKLVEYDPKTLVRTNDKAYLTDKGEPIFRARILERMLDDDY